MIRLILEAVKEWVESLLEARGRKFDVMPSIEQLFELPLNKNFYCYGFYDKEDGNGGYYYLSDNKYLSGTRKLTLNGVDRYLVPIYSSGTRVNSIYVARLGIRGVNDISSEITIADSYAQLNSDILSAIKNTSMRATLIFPEGKFVFKEPIDLTARQYGIKGARVPQVADAPLTYAGYTSGTILYFPFLANEETAITINFGNIEDVAIIGGKNVYDLVIDRTKTISAPNEVITETIGTDANTNEIKCYGLKKLNSGYIRNVYISHFYNGAYVQTSNTYISNFYAQKCNLGLSIGNDTKCVGVYGWGVHTLAEIRGSISSICQLRVDSCVHAVNVVSGNKIVLTDIDGDYCTEELIKIGKDGAWGSVNKSVFTGIHGRSCCLKAYNVKDNPNGIDVRTLGKNTEGYGLIRINKNTSFVNNYVVIAGDGTGNPFDSQSDYSCPRIIVTHGDNVLSTKNYYVVEGAIETDDDIKQSFQTLNPRDNTLVSFRVDLFNNSYKVVGDAIYEFLPTDPTDIDFSDIEGV